MFTLLSCQQARHQRVAETARTGKKFIVQGNQAWVGTRHYSFLPFVRSSFRSKKSFNESERSYLLDKTLRISLSRLREVHPINSCAIYPQDTFCIQKIAKFFNKQSTV